MNKRLFCLFLAVFIFSGCALKENLEKWDRRAGEWFFDGRPSASSTAVSSEKKSGTEKFDWRNLTPEQKKAIEEWLEDNGFNRYGDLKGIIYPGGTPLFSEKTGETKDRFEYILGRLPDLSDKINHE